MTSFLCENVKINKIYEQKKKSKWVKWQNDTYEMVVGRVGGWWCNAFFQLSFFCSCLNHIIAYILRTEIWEVGEWRENGFCGGNFSFAWQTKNVKKIVWK